MIIIPEMDLNLSESFAAVDNCLMMIIIMINVISDGNDHDTLADGIPEYFFP